MQSCRKEGFKSWLLCDGGSPDLCALLRVRVLSAERAMPSVTEKLCEGAVLRLFLTVIGLGFTQGGAMCGGRQALLHGQHAV